MCPNAANEPLIHDITTRIMADESRHVAFGVLSLEKLYTEEMSSQELREREDFVIEATRLMHGRLLQTPVFERLGYDVSYRLAGKEDVVRLSYDPGATIPVKDGQLQLAPPAAKP